MTDNLNVNACIAKGPGQLTTHLSDEARRPPKTSVLIHGDSEMAELIRSHDWLATSVGPIESWPNSLRSAVNLMLGCGFPTSIWWRGDGVQLYNDGYKPLMGAKHPAGLGQLARECWKEAWDLVSPQVQEVMEHGRPLFFENRLVPVERCGVLQDVYWTYSYSPIFGDAGQTEGVLVTCQDVTEVFISGQKLARSTEELRQVLGSITDGLLVLDKNWRYTYFNEQGASMIGMRREDLIGSIVWELFPKAEGTAFHEGYHRAVDTGQPVHFEEYYPDPLNKWLECHCYPSAQGLSVYFRDITKQRLAEEALRKSEKLALAGRMAATIAHEINNPLEAVTNLLYLLRTSTHDLEARQYVIDAEEELIRVSQIVSQSLKFHRQSTVPQWEKMSSLLDSSAALFKSRLNPDRVKIKRVYRDSSPVWCYGSELRQVFGNLVGNALDALGQGGEIHLRTRESKDVHSGELGIRITVADNGHGMDAQTLSRISEPFFTTKGANGTGLGLWVSRDLLEKHHARIQIKSRNHSGSSGTVFSIFIPLNAAGQVGGNLGNAQNEVPFGTGSRV